MARGKKAREETPTGVFLIDKPKGMTTRDILRVLNRRLGIRSSGHCGTLDPLATGVVVVMSGVATRVQDLFTGHSKEYRAEVTFGVRSETDDAEGPLTVDSSASPVLEADLLNALDQFRGPITQKPPAYSAVKVSGERLYKKARTGRVDEVEIPTRAVTIIELEFESYEWPRLTFRVVCSAGTYIRSLARDLGEVLGCGAYMSALRRTRSGPFPISECIDPDEVIQSEMLSLEDVLSEHPRCDVNESELDFLLSGRVVEDKDLGAAEGFVWFEGQCVGRAMVPGKNQVRLKRLLQDPRGSRSD